MLLVLLLFSRSLNERVLLPFLMMMGALLMVLRNQTKCYCYIFLRTDFEHHLSREEFDHHFPATHRFPFSVHAVNRCCHDADHFNFKMMTTINLFKKILQTNRKREKKKITGACFLFFQYFSLTVFHHPPSLSISIKTLFKKGRNIRVCWIIPVRF